MLAHYDTLQLKMSPIIVAFWLAVNMHRQAQGDASLMTGQLE